MANVYLLLCELFFNLCGAKEKAYMWDKCSTCYFVNVVLVSMFKLGKIK